jgi:hypothetical protein
VKPNFPNPVIFRRQRHWRLSELLAYEAAVAGLPKPDPLNPEDERYLTSGQIRQRYGVSDMWIWRRLAERTNAEAA